MKYRIVISIVLAICLFLCGCSGAANEPETSQDTENITEPAPDTAEQQEQFTDEQPSETETPQAEDAAPEFSFADVETLEFYFSSGAGAWRTVLYVDEDGNFRGFFSDSDMGDSGEGYPYGTYYYSEFGGKFNPPERIDDYTYTFTMESLDYAYDFGEEIKDCMLWKYTDAYGIAGAEELHIYLPGTPISQLPHAYLDWVRSILSSEETVLPFYGLYNVTEECGFSSSKILTIQEVVVNMIESAEAEDEEITKLLDDPYLTQTDMNIYSYDLYMVWDNTLNAIWNILKANLDPETMAQLTDEEIAWIIEKEAAMEEAGKECEGGSIYPCIVNGVATEYTRDRVYILAEYAKLIPAE